MKKPTPSPSLERHQWLEAVVDALRSKFSAAGYTIPAEVRVSIGWPKKGGGCGKRIGECWATAASSDKHAEIFVSPELASGARISDVLAHELAHATVGCEVGHKAEFRACALAIGLTGKMTATTATPEFSKWADSLFKRIGPYPGGSLTDSKKQTTRLQKCACEYCGYTVRVTRKWLDAAGPPICPTDEEPLTVS
jgi:hypothetical protein